MNVRHFRLWTFLVSDVEVKAGPHRARRGAAMRFSYSSEQAAVPRLVWPQQRNLQAQTTGGTATRTRTRSVWPGLKGEQLRCASLSCVMLESDFRHLRGPVHTGRWTPGNMHVQLCTLQMEPVDVNGSVHTAYNFVTTSKDLRVGPVWIEPKGLIHTGCDMRGEAN